MNRKNRIKYFVILSSLIVGCLAVVSYAWFDIKSAVYFNTFNGTYGWKILGAVTDFGRSEWYLLPGMIVYLVFRKRDTARAFKALYLFCSVAMSGIIVNILKVALGRARPNLYFDEHIYGFAFFETNPRFLSFPSGHAATALSAAVAFGILFPGYRYLFYSTGAVVAFSRVFLVYHYCSDVLVGALIGVSTSIILHQSMFGSTINEPEMERSHADSQ